VRKVLTVCEMKAIPYQVDPIVPFFGDDKFSELNPLRRVHPPADSGAGASGGSVMPAWRQFRRGHRRSARIQRLTLGATSTYRTPSLVHSRQSWLPTSRLARRWISMW
jgi:hypothetical protein